MKIDPRLFRSECVKLKELSSGSCFVLNAVYYALSDVRNVYGSFSAVMDLENGGMKYIHIDTRVIPLPSAILLPYGE